MQKEYYQEYYDLERTNWWFKVRNEILMQRLKIIAEKRKLKILNIGAATGFTSELLGSFGEVVSIEYDKDCCLYASEKTGLNIMYGSILDLDFEDSSFDIVCAFDVVEHVEDDKKSVSEMKRVCRKGGIVFTSVPAFMFLWSHHDVVNEHYRRYTMENYQNLYRNTTGKDGEIIYKTYFNSILFIPIALFRFISELIPKRWIRKGTGADNHVFDKKSWTSNVFLTIFRIEKFFLKSKIYFPFGVSIMLAWRKAGTNDR